MKDNRSLNDTSYYLNKRHEKRKYFLMDNVNVRK